MAHAHALRGVRHSPERNVKNKENAQAILHAWPRMSVKEQRGYPLYVWWTFVLENTTLLPTGPHGDRVRCSDVFRSYYTWREENNFPRMKSGLSLTIAVGRFLRLVGAPGLYRKTSGPTPEVINNKMVKNPAYYDFLTSKGIISEKWVEGQYK